MDKKTRHNASSNSSAAVRLSYGSMQDISELTRDSSTYTDAPDRNINIKEDVSESDSNDFLVKKAAHTHHPIMQF